MAAQWRFWRKWLTEDAQSPSVNWSLGPGAFLSYDELLKHTTSLPEDLQQVLSLEPLPAGSPLFVLNQQARQQLHQQLLRWQQGGVANIALIGPEGVGKTTLLNQLEADIEQDILVQRLSVPERIRSEPDLLRFLAKAFALQDCCDLPSLCEQLEGLSPRVILLDEAALLNLRVMDAGTVLRALWRIMLASRQLAWVHVWPEQTWRRIKWQWQLEALVSQEITLSWPTQEEFLHALHVRFALLKGERDLWWQAFDTQPARPFDLQHEGLTALYKPCQGNFFSAVYAALCALHRDMEGRIWLRGFRIPEQLNLHSVDARTRLTLAEIMAHGALSAAEHAEIFQQSVDNSAWLLGALQARQWLLHDQLGDQEVFRINPLFARSLLTALRAANALY